MACYPVALAVGAGNQLIRVAEAEQEQGAVSCTCLRAVEGQDPGWRPGARYVVMRPFPRARRIRALCVLVSARMLG